VCLSEVETLLFPRAEVGQKLLESGRLAYYNKTMLAGPGRFPLGDDGQNRIAIKLFRLARWNPYVTHWPIVLGALHRLWEMGKVSELKTPFYEPVEKPEVF
jgi:hypothetical protein